MSTAPELSPAEAARVAAFDAAPVPPECDPERVETVAQQVLNTMLRSKNQRNSGKLALEIAAAAIAALPPSPAEEAVKRVEDAIDEIADAVYDPGGSGEGVIRYQIVQRLRAALASPAPAPQAVTIDVADARAGEPEDYRAVPVDAPEVLTGDAGRAAYPPAPAPQDANGCPDQPHHGVDCPGDACRYASAPAPQFWRCARCHRAPEQHAGGREADDCVYVPELASGPAPAPQDERTAVQRDIDASLMAERLAVHQENRRIHSALPDACPVCGASSPTEHCTTVSGRDHAARNRPSR